MSLVNTKEMFKRAYEGHYSIGAFNVDTFDTFKVVCEAAKEENSPVIIQITENVIKYFGENYLMAIAKTASETGIEMALHLDHGKSVEICKKCVDLGFTSVMIDASSMSFEDNIRLTKEVVEYAHKHNVTVESELGSITGIEDDSTVEDKYGHFTHPDQVVEFVTRTNIDSLAVAIGTAHGAFKYKPDEKPALRFDILEEIEQKLPYFPLVLHGSSSISPSLLADFNKYGGNIKTAKGIDEALLSKAASINVCKINIGTDFRMSYITGLREALAKNSDKFTPRTFLSPALEKIKECVDYKQNHIFNSVNRIKEE